MRRLLTMLALPAVLLLAVAAHAEDWHLYKGQLFNVKYPAGFTVRPGAEDKSVSFRSPDGLVEFYVFSARFSEESAEYKINRSKEVCTSYSVEKEKRTTTRYVGLKAKDGSYLRAYADMLSRDSGRKVFGFKYRNWTAYSKYRPQYLKFKASLQQYAD